MGSCVLKCAIEHHQGKNKEHSSINNVEDTLICPLIFPLQLCEFTYNKHINHMVCCALINETTFQNQEDIYSAQQ